MLQPKSLLRLIVKDSYNDTELSVKKLDELTITQLWGDEITVNINEKPILIKLFFRSRK